MAHRLISIIGSRPDIVQAGPLSLAFAGLVDEVLVHTGQHYDPGMSELLIADMRLPLPDYNLGVGSLPNEKSVAVAQGRISEVIRREDPDAILVRGDTNSTLAGARAAKAAGVRLLHVEAGLRSYRDDIPEERNRVEADRISDLLFAPCEHAREVLVEEGVGGAVHMKGDVLADAHLSSQGRLPDSGEAGEYVLATVHRPQNTERPECLAAVLECLAATECRVILPLHPRTRKRLHDWGLDTPANVEVRGEVPYTEMLGLERDARAIVTDSGGVQREAYLWGVPCVTLREETEWVETVSTGWNTPVGVDPTKLRAALEGSRPPTRPQIFGDGRAAERIVEQTVAELDRALEDRAACPPRPAASVSLGRARKFLSRRGVP